MIKTLRSKLGQRRPGLLSLLVISLLWFSCQTEPRTVSFTILQINDVYEIAPSLSDGLGGLSRIATLKKELQRENKNTIMVLAGDFLNPSFIGNLKRDSNQRVYGKHMVEVLNAAGLDFATFGNHEFDLPFEVLQKRMNESEFVWVSTTVNRQIPNGAIPFEQNGQPLPNTILKDYSNEQGDKVTLGMFTSLLPFNQKSYVNYGHIYQSPLYHVRENLKNADVVVGMTHLDLQQDRELARLLDSVPLIMGGHEHHGIEERVGATLISKARANAKTAWVHRFEYNVETKKINLTSEEIIVDEDIESDSATAVVVARWVNWADSVVASEGVTPSEIVYSSNEPMDASESKVRKFQTDFGAWACNTLLIKAGNADLCVINSGSIRYDDVLPKEITARDIYKAFPFGGGLSTGQISGSELEKLLSAGLAQNMGTGGYLQVSTNISQSNGQWLLKGKPIEKDEKYTLLTSDFMWSGREKNLSFLANFETASISNNLPDAVRNDIRQILCRKD